MSLCLIDVHGDIEGDFEWAEEVPRFTNGDVIKALFPNGFISVGNRNIYYNFGEVKIQCHKDWWNAPYKKGENNA